MSWARVAGIGSVVVVSVAIAAGMRMWSVDLQRPFAAAALEIRQATGLEVAATGNFEFDLSWPPRAVGHNLTIANPAWTTRPSMAVVHRVEAELEPLSLLAGKVQVRRVHFKGVDLLLERDQNGRRNWAFAPVEGRRPLPAEWTDITFSLTDVIIYKARLAFIDHATKEERAISLDLLIAHAEDDERPIEIEADARINAAAVALAGTLGSVRQIENGLPFAIDLRAAGAGAAIAVNGEVAWPAGSSMPTTALATTVEGADLSALGPMLDIPLPPAGPYSLSTILGTDATGYRLSPLKLRVGRSDFAGEIIVEREKGQRRLAATLTSTLVDLAELDPRPAGDVATPTFDTDGRSMDLSPGFGMLAISEARIDFTGAKVVGDAFELDRVAAEVLLRDDRSTVGSFDRRGGADALTDTEGVGGDIHLTSGAGSLHLDLARTFLAEQAALLVAETGSDIGFDCMAGRFVLAGGVPMTAATVIDAPAASITGVGQVDLQAQTIEMLLTPMTKRPDLAGAMVPVIARGPLTDPEVLIEPLPAGPGDQVAGLASDPAVAPPVADALSGNACMPQLDLAIGTNGAVGMAVPTSTDVDQEVPSAAAPQVVEKRSRTRQGQSFLEALGDDINALLGSAAKSGRPTPISKRESRKLR
jgi:AsmA family